MLALSCQARNGVLSIRPSSLALFKSLKTSAVSASSGKTPIQEWGWEYLLRQRAMKRPLSPHLSIYQPQLTWYVSGAHRIAGCVMAGVLIVGGMGFVVLPLDFTTVIEFIRSLGLPSMITACFKFVIAFPIIFHTLNGIRFMGFDLAKGTDIKSVYRSGYLVLTLALVLSILVTLNKSQQR